MDQIDWENVALSILRLGNPESAEFQAPESLMRLFEEHAIYSLGDLLGATQGLTNQLPIEEDREQAEAFLAALAEELPEEVLAPYRADQPELPPPGVLDDEEDF